MISSLLQVSCYILFNYFSRPHYFLLVALGLNVVVLGKILSGFGLKYTLTRLGRGEILPLTLYMAWLVLYYQDEHLYRIPIILSCIGKTYLLFSVPEDLWIDAVENLIILQSQCEMFIVFYHVLKLSVGKKSQIEEATIEFLLLVLINKIKFEIHYGTRKCYESIHFGLDRCAKSLKMRPCYHFLQRLFSNLAGEWHHSKVVSY